MYRLTNINWAVSFCFVAFLPILLSACSGDDVMAVADDGSSAGGASSFSAVSGATSATKDPKTLRGALTAAGVDGWMDGDSVNVYRFGTNLHNSYRLSSGSGTIDGVFVRTSGTDSYDTDETLYGLANEKYKYSLSPTLDGEAQLAVYVPFSLPLNEVGAPKGCSRLPLPCWSVVSFGADGRLEGQFRSLTTLLRLDSNELPPGTRAVLLTTAPLFMLGSYSYEEGSGEPISGIFDTILGEDARLKTNEIFVNADTLRVNVGEEVIPENRRYLYLPVVPQKYSNLYIVAVFGDLKRAYRWQGEVIKTYADTTFEPNTVVTVTGISTGITPVTL